MAGFRFSFDELVWLMSENMLCAFPTWLSSSLDEAKHSNATNSLASKEILFKCEDKYAILPAIEYLMNRMNRARIWLTISNLYFIYIDTKIVVCLYNAFDSTVTVTPYESPEQCFMLIQSALDGEIEYTFVVDESSADIKTYYDEVRLVWENLYEQRKNCN